MNAIRSCHIECSSVLWRLLLPWWFPLLMIVSGVPLTMFTDPEFHKPRLRNSKMPGRTARLYGRTYFICTYIALGLSLPWRRVVNLAHPHNTFSSIPHRIAQKGKILCKKVGSSQWCSKFPSGSIVTDYCLIGFALVADRLVPVRRLKKPLSWWLVETPAYSGMCNFMQDSFHLLSKRLCCFDIVKPLCKKRLREREGEIGRGLSRWRDWPGTYHLRS